MGELPSVIIRGRGEIWGILLTPNDAEFWVAFQPIPNFEYVFDTFKLHFALSGTLSIAYLNTKSIKSISSTEKSIHWFY